MGMLSNAILLVQRGCLAMASGFASVKGDVKEMNQQSEGKASKLVRSNATRASTGFTTYQLRQTPSIYYLTNTDSDTSES